MNWSEDRCSCTKRWCVLLLVAVVGLIVLPITNAPMSKIAAADPVIQNQLVQNQVVQNQRPGGLFPPAQGRNSLPNGNLGRHQQVDVDAEMQRLLDKAKSEFDRNEYRSGLEILQKRFFDPSPATEDDRGALLSSADSFSDLSGRSSCRRIAKQLIAELPPEGKRIYEADFGLTANVLLTEAEANNDIGLLEDVVRRYPMTLAARTARYRLGSYHLDRGDPAAAVRYFSQMYATHAENDNTDDSLDAKNEIESDRDKTIHLVQWGLACLKSGRQADFERVVQMLQHTADKKLLDDNVVKRILESIERSTRTKLGSRQLLSQIKSWKQEDFHSQPVVLDGWPMKGGNTARNAAGGDVIPFGKSEWRDSTLVNPYSPLHGDEYEQAIYDLLGETLGSLKQEDRAALPACSPIVVADKVIFRTLDCVRAVDIETGKLIWETAVTDHLAHELFANKPSSGKRQTYQISAAQRRSLYFKKRGWEDQTVGSLSSNGSLVFSIEDAGLVPSPVRSRISKERIQPYNRLCAFDVKSGKLIWELGGPTDTLPALECAGSLFLGPPVPHQSELYVLAERQGEIRLWALDANTGTVNWSQSIVLLNDTSGVAYRRRLLGISPVLAGDLIVCPTGAGATVAVDRVQRELTWIQRKTKRTGRTIYQHQRVQNFRFRGSQGAGIVQYLKHQSAWSNETSLVAQGKVFLTPSDSNELYCVDLMTGEQKWMASCPLALYVATVYQDNVVIVTENDVYALDVRDGKPTWPRRLPISTPAGTGIVVEGRYHLPLSSGEVMTIDLAEGRLLARSPVSNGVRLGNIISAGQRVISQNVESVFSLPTRPEVLEKLQQSLETVKLPEKQNELLALRGEMHLHDGHVVDALKDLEPLAQGGNQRIQKIVARTLLEGLRFDFQSYKKSLPKLDHLLPADGPLRFEYHSLLAERYEAEQNHFAALGEYAALGELIKGQPRFKSIQQGWTIGMGQWLSGKILEHFHLLSTEESRDFIDASLQKMNLIFLEGKERQIMNLMSTFGQLPFVRQARFDALKQHELSSISIRDAMFLRQFCCQADDNNAAQATALLVGYYLELKAYEPIPELLGELESRFAKVPCLGETTGGEYAARIRADKNLRAIYLNKQPWANRHLEVHAEELNEPRVGELINRMIVVGPRPVAYEGWSFRYNMKTTTKKREFKLGAFDAQGKQRWSTSVVGGQTRRNARISARIALHGDMMFLVLDDLLVCYSMAGPSGRPRRIWSYFIGSTTDEILQSTRRGPLLVSNRTPFVAFNDSYVAVRQGRSVVAISSDTGRLLWRRELGSQTDVMFGDEDHLYSLSISSSKVFVYIMSDGSLVKEYDLINSSDQKRIAERRLREKMIKPLQFTDGRLLMKMFVVEQDAVKTAIKSVDLATGKTVWIKQWEEDSMFNEFVLGGDRIALFRQPVTLRYLKSKNGIPGLMKLLRGPATLHILSIQDGRSLYEQQAAGETDKTITRFDRIVSLGREFLVTSRRYQFEQAGMMEKVPKSGQPPEALIVDCIDQESFKKRWTKEFKETALRNFYNSGGPVVLFDSKHGSFAFKYRLLDLRNGRLKWLHVDKHALFLERWKWDREAEKIDITLANQNRNRRQQLHVKLSDIPLDQPDTTSALVAPLPEDD